MQTFAVRALLLLLVVCFASGDLFAQTKEDLASEREALKEARRVEKQMQQFEKEHRKDAARAAAKGSTVGTLSFRNFVRGAVATGNLIQVPYVTNVNISGGYWGSTVSPSRITWPKGSGVEYGHTMSFIVAGEVTNDNGSVLRILTESYNRSGGDTHPSGSHKFFFGALPGYYNMKGDPSTTNRLNDNVDDRRLLDETGFYFVGGLNEDANGNGALDPGEDLNNKRRIRPGAGQRCRVHRPVESSTVLAGLLAAPILRRGRPPALYLRVRIGL